MNPDSDFCESLLPTVANSSENSLLDHLVSVQTGQEMNFEKNQTKGLEDRPEKNCAGKSNEKRKGKVVCESTYVIRKIKCDPEMAEKNSENFVEDIENRGTYQRRNQRRYNFSNDNLQRFGPDEYFNTENHLGSNKYPLNIDLTSFDNYLDSNIINQNNSKKIYSKDFSQKSFKFNNYIQQENYLADSIKNNVEINRDEKNEVLFSNNSSNFTNEKSKLKIPARIYSQVNPSAFNFSTENSKLQISNFEKMHNSESENNLLSQKFKNFDLTICNDLKNFHGNSVDISKKNAENPLKSDLGGSSHQIKIPNREYKPRPDHLPVNIDGEKTDCSNFIQHLGAFPQKFYLPDDLQKNVFAWFGSFFACKNLSELNNDLIEQFGFRISTKGNPITSVILSKNFIERSEFFSVSRLKNLFKVRVRLVNSQKTMIQIDLNNPVKKD